MNKNLPVIEVPASGKPNWLGGAWTINFVYSNRGNFILKGYAKETSEWLEKEKGKGLKYFVNRVLYGGRSICGFKMNRNYWFTYSRKLHLYSPSPKKTKLKRNKKWRFTFYDSESWSANVLKEIKFKRLPNKWLPEFDYNNAVKS